MRKIYVLFWLLACLIQSKAQTPFTNWQFTIPESTGSDRINASCLDNDGNLIVVGHFYGTVDFDHSAGERKLAAVGQYDGFVAKYNPFGEIIWAYRLGGTLGDQINSVAVDNFNSIYLTGFFMGTMNISVPNGNFPLVSNGNSADVFMVKLNANGQHLNSYKIGSAGNDRGNTIKVDNVGNVYVCGAYSSPNNNTNVNFNVLGGTNNLLASGAEDGFVVKYDASFVLQWVRSYGSSANNDAGQALDIDASGNVYIAGYFTGTNAGFNNLIFLTASGQDGFIMKINAAGNTIWARKIGGSGTDYFSAIKLDGKGTIYACGNFASTANLNPNGTAQNFTAVGGDAFVSKLDTNGGTAIWIKAFGGNGLDLALALQLDSTDNVYITGSFQGTAQFPIGTPASQLTSNGGKDIYGAKLNSLGNYVWIKQLGFAGDDEAASIATTMNGQNSYLTGNSNNLGLDLFMAKIGTCAEVGTISGPIKLCTNTPVVYSVDSVPGATSYIWSLPAGYTGNSSSRTITVTPGTSSGNITINAITPCGAGFTRSLAINYGTSTLDNNLIRYYTANASQNNLDIKNNFGLTLTQVSQDTGRYGAANGAYRINNANGFIKLQPEANLPASGPLSIAFWYYYVKTGSNNVVLGSNGTTLPAAHPLLLTVNSSGKLFPWSSAGAAIGSGADLQENSWNHIILSRNGANFDFYVNGKYLYGGNNLSLSNFDRIGNNRPGFETQGATGKFDEIKIYNTLISEVQAQAIYEFGGNVSTLFPSSVCKNTTLTISAPHSSPSANYVWRLNGSIVGSNQTSFSKNAQLTDSLISLSITNNCFVESIGNKFKVNNQDSIYITSNTCEFKLGNRVLYTSGTYIDTFQNRSGCDSIVYVNLTINKASFPNLSNGLIRYWTLNAVDSLRDVISKQNLIANSNSLYMVDRLGTANASLRISASSHVFRPSLDLPTSDITFSFWYYYISGFSNTRALLSNNLTTNAGYYLYIDPNGVVKGNNAAGANFNSNATLTTNQWYHFTYTLSNTGDARIYVNGNLALSISNVSLSGITRIGNGLTSSNTTPGYGYYDDIRVYNRVLNDSEIGLLPSRPSLYEISKNTNICLGDSAMFSIRINHQESNQIESYKNTNLIGSDSIIRIPNIGVNDSLVSFKIYSKCAVEEYKLPITIIPTSAIVNDSFCGNYVFNGKTYSLPGTYYDTAFNSNGCRVITQLNLSPSGSNELSNGLIRYWLGNGSNGNVSLIGNDTLTPVGNIALTGWAGRAENANGSIFNGLINNTYLKTNLPTMGNYTISFWYKMETNGVNRQLNLLANNSTTAAGSVILAKTTGNVLHVLNSSGTPIGSGFNMIANVWNHITLARNGNNFSLYVNGNLITSGANINPANPDHIGNNGVTNNGNSAIGWYDDIKVYNRAISATEVTAIYNMPSVLSTPNLSNFCLGYPGSIAFQFQRDSSSSIQFLRNGNVVANDTFFTFTQILPTDTSIGYRIIKACASETVTLTFNNQPINLNNGLIRYWPFNDAVSNRRDLQTNQTFGYLGSFDNTTGRTGLANTGLHISGVGKIVYSNTSLPSGATSISLWYQRVSAAYTGARTIISNNQSNGNIAKYLYINNNGALFCGTNTSNAGVNTNVVLGLNQWNHLVYTITPSGQVTLYVNGNLVVTLSGVPVHPITYIGNRPDGNEPGVGNYDDVRIYNRILNPVEAQKLFGMPSLISIPHNVQACEGSSLNLSFLYGPAANKLYTITKNGVVVGTDSTLRINAVNASDTLFNFSLNTNCGQENHTIKVIVNPATGVGPTLNYSKITSRITANSSFTSYKLYRNGVVVDSSNTVGNINYLTNKCGSYIAEFRNTSTGGCPVVSPVLTITIDTVLVQAAICAGNTFAFGNQQLNTAGIYYRTINSVLGCDSTIRLNLNVKQASTSSISRSGCGVISLFGKNYTQSGTYKDTLINAAGCDSIITLNLSIAPGNPTHFNLNINECKQFVFNGKTYTSSGIYRDTLFGANANGCDSIIVLNLNIQNINKNVNKTGNTLTSLETNASYQWYNCGTQSLIANATASSYTPASSGNYAVIISKNNCIDTSNCTLVTINNCNISTTFTVFPNQDTMLCKDGTVTIKNASLPLSLNLSWVGNPVGVSIQKSDSVHVYNDLCPETYLLRVTDAQGCKDSIQFIITQPSVGITELNRWQINVFPNPAQNSVNISGAPIGSNISVIDLQGKILKNNLVQNDETHVYTGDLADGIYFIYVNNGTKIESKKLIINR